jgi:hypothetical protein
MLSMVVDLLFEPEVGLLVDGILLSLLQPLNEVSVIFDYRCHPGRLDGFSHAGDPTHLLLVIGQHFFLLEVVGNTILLLDRPDVSLRLYSI